MVVVGQKAVDDDGHGVICEEGFGTTQQECVVAVDGKDAIAIAASVVDVVVVIR